MTPVKGEVGGRRLGRRCLKQGCSSEEVMATQGALMQRLPVKEADVIPDAHWARSLAIDVPEKWMHRCCHWRLSVTRGPSIGLLLWGDPSDSSPWLLHFALYYIHLISTYRALGHLPGIDLHTLQIVA